MGDFFFKVEVTSHLRVAVEGGVIAGETGGREDGKPRGRPPRAFPRRGGPRCVDS